MLQIDKAQRKISFQQAGDDHQSADRDTIGHECGYQRNLLSAAWILRRIHSIAGGFSWRNGIIRLLICTTVFFTALVALGLYRIYFDRTNLPPIEPLARFEFATIGHVYDVHGQPLIELAREYRRNISYQDIPPVVRDAILAAEDKNFFIHNGVDYSVFPRVLSKIRFKTLKSRLTTLGREDEGNSEAIFPHGGSTITQQLVRYHFLKELTSFQDMTVRENSDQLQQGVLLPRILSYLIGSHSVNMLVRKLEEIRLSIWIEDKMKESFGSKRRAKEEILARYASLIYMGNGQYGFAAAAEYYFDRPLATFTADDADLAALLASIAKSPSHYAPDAKNTERVLRRRNQSLALMAANGFISQDKVRDAQQRPIQLVMPRKNKATLGPAVVGNVLQELKDRHADLSFEDLMQGRIQIYSTVDARIQQIVDDALEHGLALYEKRHPAAKGLIQGSVVVLRNRDASILAETGGRQLYQDRSSLFSDFNRVTGSLRQPGSAMKPIVYLAAFQQGKFNLDTLVPDKPISVPDGGNQKTKWISNYDGQFKGLIPLREALAQSRNAVAIWITERIGINSVTWTAQTLGIQTPLHPYATTALGASEVNLMELANAYRTIASGISSKPYVIRKIVRNSGEVVVDNEHSGPPVSVSLDALALIQEGLRGIVRMPTGTAHALDTRSFPIPVMGKTGTTNDFRDALFVGSTYGPEGITIAVRIGFDDNRSLGRKETGGRVALPVFKNIMLSVYSKMLAGPVPAFPDRMEQSINKYLKGDRVEDVSTPEIDIPQNIEAPLNTEAKRIIPYSVADVRF
ncbi:MAG: penicillin-binding protein 1 [Deltaproteobacteria bacterium]|nr:penicillin-binding protein 1 [Deltaproteobacteria bacterium]